ncbi:hypothetical protein BV20DRAFT_74664 [Pilatotrama ljubarskyi]|nr:hypothetical protein BV20DRAFT_74664 [Pilatotrama ljubarskyi]
MCGAQRGTRHAAGAGSEAVPPCAARRPLDRHASPWTARRKLRYCNGRAPGHHFPRGIQKPSLLAGRPRIRYSGSRCGPWSKGDPFIREARRGPQSSSGSINGGLWVYHEVCPPEYVRAACGYHYIGGTARRNTSWQPQVHQVLAGGSSSAEGIVRSAAPTERRGAGPAWAGV